MNNLNNIKNLSITDSYGSKFIDCVNDFYYCGWSDKIHIINASIEISNNLALITGNQVHYDFNYDNYFYVSDNLKKIYYLDDSLFKTTTFFKKLISTQKILKRKITTPFELITANFHIQDIRSI